MKRCFILANGESRKDFDHNRLWSYGKVIGINAIYREKPKIDYLVGVDIQMMNEVGEAQYRDCEVWTYPRVQIKHEYFQRFTQDKGWSSGPTATWLANKKSSPKYTSLAWIFVESKKMAKKNCVSTTCIRTPKTTETTKKKQHSMATGKIK